MQNFSNQITDICSRLAANKQVRRTLPGKGRLHIDRQVPFLCVYRRPTGGGDPGTDRLVLGEASYLRTSGAAAHQQVLTQLVQKIVGTLSPEFGAFLIIEVWAGPEVERPKGKGALPPRPSFRLVSQPAGPSSTADTLAKYLGKVRVLKRSAEVDRVEAHRIAPPGMKPLLSKKQRLEFGCHLVGVEVSPIYRDTSGRDYPLVRRALHRGMSLAFRRAFFKFADVETTNSPPHFHSLGPHALVKAVWDVDRQLSEVVNAFDFLLLSTPVNADAAWAKFKTDKFSKSPVFHYRPVPIWPSDLKAKLYGIPIHRVEDPTLSDLFEEKRQQLETRITMIHERGTRRYMYGSLMLHGEVDDGLLNTAKDILAHIPPGTRDDSRGGHLDAKEFAKLARAEIKNYQKQYEPFASKVIIRKDIPGIMTSSGNLLVGKSTRIPVGRADAMIQHEVGTHLLAFYNGGAQPFRLIRSGLPGYDELQEGLAVLAEYLAGGLSRPRLRILAGRVVGVDSMVRGATFVETFRLLRESHGFDRRNAFQISMRVHRGGGLTKDAVYLRGLLRVLAYLKKGRELTPLFVGKISAEHVPIIKELQWRKVLKQAPLLPSYLSREDARDKLEGLRKGMTPLELIHPPETGKASK